MLQQRKRKTVAQHAKELARAVAELERSNRELDEFVSVVAHDLHAPLRAVIAFCNMLQRDYAEQLGEKADEYINAAVESSARMQRLIDDLREYSRVTHKRRRMKRVACEQILAEALANLKAYIEASGALITHDALPTVRADATQLLQLFQNLIGNAIKYCDRRPPEVHIGAELRSGEWLFSIRDNGIGIAPRHAVKIFQIFQRLHTREEKYEGTGVGLAICKKIIERLGGRIWVKSTPDIGSVFSFTIPEHP